MCVKKGSVFSLRAWRKSDKNRVPALDRSIPHPSETNRVVNNIEVIGDYILILWEINSSTYQVDAIAKPSL